MINLDYPSWPLCERVLGPHESSIQSAESNGGVFSTPFSKPVDDIAKEALGRADPASTIQRRMRESLEWA